MANPMVLSAGSETAAQDGSEEEDEVPTDVIE